MTSRPRLSIGLAILGLALSICGAHAEGDWKHATALMGEPKYAEGFERFDYVNPDAPKGGELRMSEEGTFDTFNPILAKGDAAIGLSLVFDTLMKSNEEEVSTSYGLIAEAVSFPDDISQATFRLRAEAKWADGEPITPEDVIFSFESAKAHNPLQASYYSHVTGAEKTGDREVTFTFDQTDNKELPQILGQLIVLPKHWWEGENADGVTRDISKTTLEPVMGSGPYRIASFSPGSTIVYERRDDYWAKDLNVNVGQNNFGRISYTYFADANVELESFRAGNVDFRQENSSSRWATAYDFPDVQSGKVIREEFENPLRATGGYGIGRPEFDGTIGAPTPTDSLSLVIDYARRYDGWTDWVQNTDDPIAVQNAMSGRSTLHRLYTEVDLFDPNHTIWRVDNTLFVLTYEEALPFFKGEPQPASVVSATRARCEAAYTNRPPNEPPVDVVEPANSFERGLISKILAG